MAQRGIHGAQKECGGPEKVLETLPVLELPDGEPAPTGEQERARQERKAGGRGIPPGATAIPRLGGKAHKGKPHMVERVALTPPAANLPTRRYHVAAKSLARSAAATIASVVGGGQLDPHTGYLVTAAARAAKWANYYSDLAERMPEGSKEQRDTVATALSADEKASSHLRNAHEYAARMAEARKKTAPAGPPLFYTAAAEEPSK